DPGGPHDHRPAGAATAKPLPPRGGHRAEIHRPHGKRRTAAGNRGGFAGHSAVTGRERRPDRQQGRRPQNPTLISPHRMTMDTIPADANPDAAPGRPARAITRLLAALCAALAPIGAAVAADSPWYQVEVIVFAQSDPYRA